MKLLPPLHNTVKLKKWLFDPVKTITIIMEVKLKCKDVMYGSNICKEEKHIYNGRYVY